VVKTELELATVVECFHARKFSAKPDKRGALKVNCSGTAKKQKKPIKTGMQGAQKVLDKDKMEAMLQMTKTRPGELREVMTGQSDGAPKVEPQNPTRRVWTLSPKIVFISETRQQSNRVRNIKGRLALNNCFLVNGRGKGGGLALYWDNSIKLNIVSYGMHHIDTLIWDGDHDAAWHGTFVYGEPRA
jgi:hypothetical protein